MNKTYTTIAIIFVFMIYIIINLHLDNKRIQKTNAALFGKIEQLNQRIAENNKIIADNENNKRELENQSIERQEQINEQLKNNNCANEYVPVSVADGLYNRAKNIRYSANPGESTR
jgi:ABC-type multidrug transport system fused ATPase/permease subunit